MTILKTDEYEKRKIQFLHKHEDWTIETSPMNADGVYHKTYICTDGAVWTEVNRPVWEKIPFVTTVKGVKISFTHEVKLLETEGWSTDDANSIYCYEKF